MPAPRKRYPAALKIVLLAGIAAAAFVVAANRLPHLMLRPDLVSGPPELSNVMLPAPQPLKAFALRDGNREAFDLERLQGRWTMVFFGYTSCPDICPTALATLREVAGHLESEENVQYVFVSVDPARDTPERVGEYVEFFHPGFIGVSGDPERIEALMKQFNVMAKRNPGDNPDAYTIAHTSSIMLVGPDARLLGSFSPPHKARRIADQFQALRNYLEES